MSQTGLRVSELINLKCEDISFESIAHLRCREKGANNVLYLYPPRRSRFSGTGSSSEKNLLLNLCSLAVAAAL